MQKDDDEWKLEPSVVRWQTQKRMPWGESVPSGGTFLSVGLGVGMMETYPPPLFSLYLICTPQLWFSVQADRAQSAMMLPCNL